MPSVRHSAKSDDRWPPSRAGHLLPSGTFTECRGTRQSPDLPRARLCRVPGTRQSHLCRVLYFTQCGTRQNIALPSALIKSTWQSLRHSAKSSFPVVKSVGYAANSGCPLAPSCCTKFSIATNQTNTSISTKSPHPSLPSFICTTMSRSNTLYL